MDQASNLFNDDELKEIFEKDILELMGAKEMEEEKKQALYLKMAQTVQDRVILRIDDTLDEPSKAEWIQIATEGDKTKMEEYLKSKNIDVAKMMVEEAIIYKVEMMAMLKQAKTLKKDQSE